MDDTLNQSSSSSKTTSSQQQEQSRKRMQKIEEDIIRAEGELEIKRMAKEKESDKNKGDLDLMKDCDDKVLETIEKYENEILGIRNKFENDISLLKKQQIKEVSELRKENFELKIKQNKEISDLKKQQNKELTELKKEQNEKIIEMKKEENKLNNIISDKDIEIEELGISFKKKELDLEKKLFTFIDEKYQLLEQLNEKSEMEKEYTTQIETYEQQHSMNLEEVKKLVDKCEELNKLNNELNKSKIDLDEELTERKKEIDNLIKCNEQLKDQANSEKEEKLLLSNQLNEFQSQIDKLNYEKNQLNDKLNHITNQYNNSENKIALDNAKSEMAKDKEQLTAITNELENLRMATRNLAVYVYVPNEIIEFDDHFTCCENKCINSNISNGTCSSNKGYIRVNDDKAVYYRSKNDHENDGIQLFAKKINKADICLKQRFSVYYFEVQLLDVIYYSTAKIGFENLNEHFDFAEIYSNDFIGCGIVFTPKDVLETKDLKNYIFYTQNGRRFFDHDKSIHDELTLTACSGNINFGKDLVNTPFKYNIHQHFF